MIRNLQLVTPALAALLATAITTSPARAVTIDWVVVGNPNNPADVNGLGSVGYTYRIGTYEVTNAQYAAFLNAVAADDPNGLYDVAMDTFTARSGIERVGSPGSYTYNIRANMADKPVNLIAYPSAMRFVNWLENGQPTGPQGPTTTETGTYTMGAWLSETRALGANYFLPTRDEWYKAAYHHPESDGGNVGDYWPYATGATLTPTIATATVIGDIENPGANVANYANGTNWNGLSSGSGNVTTVGSAGPLSASYYGTYDQTGNVWEFTEGISGSNRVIHGGGYSSGTTTILAGHLLSVSETEVNQNIGFRVASLFVEPQAEIVPEPGTWALGTVGLLMLLAWRYRRRTMA